MLNQNGGGSWGCSNLRAAVLDGFISILDSYCHDTKAINCVTEIQQGRLL